MAGIKDMEEMEIVGLEEIETENTAIDDIDSEIVDLIFTGIDETGSMYSYVSDMKKCLSEFKNAITNSKEVDQILVARGNFSNCDVDIKGYKKIEEFDTDYKANGGTPLYDTIVTASKKLIDYMDYLRDEGMRVKAVFSIFSDGDDTTSKYTFAEARTAIEELKKKEVVTAFISFGDEAKAIAKRLDFSNILEVGSSASELRRAFNCLSKSVIENSQSVVSKQDDFFEV